MKNDKLIGTAAIIGSAAVYGTYGIVSRLISTTFSTFSQSYYRDFVGLVLILIILSIFKLWKPIEHRDKLWIAILAVSGAIVMLFMYYAINKMPIGTTYFVYYPAMILTGYITSVLWFQEKMNWEKIVSLILAGIGIMILFSFEYRPDFLVPVICAILAGFFTGIFNTSSKKVSERYHPLQLFGYSCVVSIIIGGLLATITNEPFPILSFKDTGTIVNTLAGGSILISNSLLFIGFLKLPASLASTLLPLEVIFASVLAFLFFGETMSPFLLISGSLIFVSAIFPDLVSYAKEYIYKYSKND